MQVPLSKAHIGFLGEYYCNEVIAESPKFACSGVTLALACRPFAPDWRWQNA